MGGPTATRTSGLRRALLPPPEEDHWYWARDGKVLARFTLDRLDQPASVTPLPSETGVSWGAWILSDGEYTYVYGSEDLGDEKFLHVAEWPAPI